MKKIFIVGVGRSGTTLLMSMLNAHPDIAFPPEFHFIRNYILRYQSLSLNDTVSILADDPYFARLNLPIRDALSPFYAGEPFSLSALYSRILTIWSKQQGAIHVGDKDPKNVESLPIIKALYPDAYVLHMIRDPRDVYLSRKKATWSKNRRKFAHLVAYQSQMTLGQTQGKQLFNGRYKEVKYEELLQSPEIELREISKFLGIPFDKEMLAFQESARQIVTVDEMQWKGNALGDLQSNNFNKWCGQLDQNEILAIENGCRVAFSNGYYDLSVSANSFLETFYCRSWRYLVELASNLYQSRVTSRSNHTVDHLAFQ